RPVVLCANVVAIAHLSVPGRPGHRRRMGGGCFAPVRDLAAPLAAVAGCGPPDRRQPGRHAGRTSKLSPGSVPPSHRVPGWCTARAAGALDSPRGARAGGMADGQRAVRTSRAELTLLVCALALTAHWAFLFWYLQHLRNLPDLSSWTDAEKSQ